MSIVLAAGIDLGNVTTRTAIFKTNDADVMRSAPVKIADRNGRKDPSSEIYFDEGNRVTGTAAAIVSNRNPPACIKFVKCSIKRPFADISEHIKKIISAIREDANKNVQYTVNINKADQNLWPSHMAGVYLSNVIADVSSSYKCENVCSTISIPSYYTNEQISDFRAGLHVAKVESYVLIREIDSIAIEYAFYRSINKEFDKEPRVVLFVGVGFAAAQAYVVRFGKDRYEILSQAFSQDVSSSDVDSIVYDLMCEEYNNERDEDGDPELTDIPDLYFRMFDKVVSAKQLFSDRDIQTAETCIPEYNDDGDDFYLAVEEDRLREQMEEKGLIEKLKDMLTQCLESAGDVNINDVQIIDQGLLTPGYLDCVQEVLEERGVEMHVDSAHISADRISNGNSMYSFYLTHYGEAEYTRILPSICDTVVPLIVQCPFVKKTGLEQSSGFSDDAKKMMEEADSVEQESRRLQEKANRIKKLLNEYQQFIQDTKAKISDRSHGQENLYYLNADELDSCIRKWDQWFRANQDASEEVIVRQIQEMQKERDSVQAKFKIKHEEEVRRLREEEARREQEQRELKRRQEEERLRKEMERRVMESEKWKRVFEDSHVLSAYVSPADKTWLNESKKVILKYSEFDYRDMTPCISKYLDQMTGVRGSGVRQLTRSGGVGGGGGFSSMLGSMFGHHGRNAPRFAPGYENDYEDIYEEDIDGYFGGGDDGYGYGYGYGVDGRLGIGLKERVLHITPSMVPLNMERIPAPSCSAIMPFIEEIVSMGTVKLSPNYQYEGEMLAGIPHGTGTMTELVSNKIVYKGEWKNGQYDGCGMLYLDGTRVEEGIFKSGELVEGKRFLPSGAFHIGHFVNHKLQGPGRVVFPSGIMVEGNWNAGQPIGEMTYTFANGEVQKYDEKNKMNHTEFEISWREESVSYLNNHAAVQNVEHLYYPNGDVFLGGTKQGIFPLNGYYLKYLTKSATYSVMRIGTPAISIEQVSLETISGKYKRIQVTNIEKI